MCGALKRGGGMGGGRAHLLRLECELLRRLRVRGRRRRRRAGEHASVDKAAHLPPRADGRRLRARCRQLLGRPTLLLSSGGDGCIDLGLLTLLLLVER